MRILPIFLVIAVLAVGCSEVDADALIEGANRTAAEPEDDIPEDDIPESVSTTSTPASTPTTEPSTTAAPSTSTTEPAITRPKGAGADEVPDAPPGQTGSVAAPVPAGQIADAGDGWRVQVLGFEADATATILEENQFNDPPPDGSVFTIVRIGAGYYGTDDPANWFDLNISAVEESVETDTSCGVIPDQFPFSQVYAGGTFEGNVCFVTSGVIADLTLYAEQLFSFDSDQVFLEIAEPTTVDPLPSLTGPQPGADSSTGRRAPIPVGTPTVLGDDWTVSLGGGRDGTEEILATNDFNDPPPDGFSFYLFDMDATYNGEETGAIYDLSVDGVADSNVDLDSWCGVHDGDFEFDVDVFPGGTISGTMCFVVPTNEIGSLVVSVSESFSFDDVDFYFAPT